MLIISHAAINWQASDFAAICRTSRRNNAACTLSAALLFDGDCFAELIEGPRDQVRRLVDTMSTDPRHRGLEIIGDIEDGESELGEAWSSGFCEPGALDIFFGPDGLRGTEAVAAMRGLLRSVDLSA